MLEGLDTRKAFPGAFEKGGLELIALNANGNQLHPTDGVRQSDVLLQRLEGVLCSVEVLRAAAPDQLSDFAPPPI